jgi:hypothetical protein
MPSLAGETSTPARTASPGARQSEPFTTMTSRPHQAARQRRQRPVRGTSGRTSGGAAAATAAGARHVGQDERWRGSGNSGRRAARRAGRAAATREPELDAARVEAVAAG